MNIQDIREIMGLTQAQVADELNVPRQEVIDCEENGETYLLLQYISAFPINPQILKDPEVDPFLPSFDQTTPGHRARLWREEYNISVREMAEALGISEEELIRLESDSLSLNRRRGEEIEKRTGLNRKWLMYGDGRFKGEPTFRAKISSVPKEESAPRAARTSAPNRAAGLRIKEMRKAAGLSREELGDLLDLSASRIAQMESGYVKEKKADHIISRIEAATSVQREETPREAGLRLREARKALNLPVKEAAAALGLKHTTLAHLESGYITSRHADELISQLQSALPAPEVPVFDPREAGIKIREERTQAGLSQKELGTILRLPVTRVSLIELGHVNETEYRNILRRIHGLPLREIVNRRVKPTDQVILGANIREAREQAGLSQKALGDLLQMPQTRISLMERGKVDEATAERVLAVLAQEQSRRDQPDRS